MSQVYLDLSGAVFSLFGIIFDGLAVGVFEINYAKLVISLSS